MLTCSCLVIVLENVWLVSGPFGPIPNLWQKVVEAHLDPTGSTESVKEKHMHKASNGFPGPFPPAPLHALHAL